MHIDSTMVGSLRIFQISIEKMFPVEQSWKGRIKYRPVQIISIKVLEDMV